MKLFKIITLGCKVNQYESDWMRAVCLHAGYTPAGKKERADLIVLNSCAVTSVASAKSRRALRQALKSNHEVKVIATGCAVKAAPQSFAAIDDTIVLLPESGKQGFPALIGVEVPDGLFAVQTRTRAFLKIQDGCNQYCAYCIVAHMRPKLWSKPANEALAETEHFVALGHREIVLTGVRLGLYDGGGVNLAGLIEMLATRTAVARIRLSSIEIIGVTDELLAVAQGRKFCRHLHVPLQSGDDAILKAMNRPYTASQFLERIAAIRHALPGVAITTDVIVGFPGETEENFENTLHVCREAGFSKIHIFPFSPRTGTKAAVMKNRPDGRVVEKRLERLRLLEEEMAARFRQNLVGKVSEVLVEKKIDRQTGLPCGTSQEYVKIYFERGWPKVGEIVGAKILRANALNAFAEIVSD